ncbi:hypothetical protein ABZ669_35890 [Streptomyces hirsutus]|uniref:hypothetical protein n=1 Tax=Streptomyces hirsutus TaxID=35620 RepID=UPI0034087641
MTLDRVCLCWSRAEVRGLDRPSPVDFEVVEDWHAELWLDDAETIDLYRRVGGTCAEAVVFGAEAQQVIARVRRGIKV